MGALSSGIDMFGGNLSMQGALGIGGNIGGLIAGNTISNAQSNYLSGMIDISKQKHESDVQMINARNSMNIAILGSQEKITQMVLDSNIEMKNREREYYQEKAYQVMERAASEESIFRERANSMKGTQRATIAASGLSAESGTMADVQIQTVEAIERDASVIRYNAVLEKWGVDMQIADIGVQNAMLGIEKERAAGQLQIDIGLSNLNANSQIAASKYGSVMEQIDLGMKKAEVELQKSNNLTSALSNIGMTFMTEWHPYSNSIKVDKTSAAKGNIVQGYDYNDLKVNPLMSIDVDRLPVSTMAQSEMLRRWSDITAGLNPADMDSYNRRFETMTSLYSGGESRTSPYTYSAYGTVIR